MKHCSGVKSEVLSVDAVTLSVDAVDTKATIDEQMVAKRFSKGAAHYDSLANIQRVIAAQTLTHLPAVIKGDVLDVGCGTGIHTNALSMRGASTTGIDIAEGMLSLAATTYSSPKFICASATALPFAANQFSVVFSSMALQWVKSPISVANQVATVLEQEGIAELAILVEGSFAELTHARNISQLPEARTPLPSSREWEEAFKTAGLVLSRVIVKDYVDMHDDILSLLRSIKTIGAGETGRQQPPLSRRDINKLAMAYKNTSGVNGKLPLTYRVSHFRLINTSVQSKKNKQSPK